MKKRDFIKTYTKCPSANASQENMSFINDDIENM